MSDVNLWLDVAVGVLGGAVRVGTPFLFVSLGECLTEKSGRINLGLEGVLVLSAMAGFAGSYLSGSAWAGVLLAGVVGALLAGLHGVLCSLKGHGHRLDAAGGGSGLLPGQAFDPAPGRADPVH
jgi:ABC-type uncharacterized transport system permease subunit